MEYASSLAEKFQFIILGCHTFLLHMFAVQSFKLKDSKCFHTILNTTGGYMVHKGCRWNINIPISVLAATKTFPPPSIKLVIAATSSDPPNSKKRKKILNI